MCSPDGKKVKLLLYPLPRAINQRKAREENLSDEEELEEEAIEDRTSTEQEVAIENQTFTDHKGRRWVFQVLRVLLISVAVCEPSAERGWK